MPEKQGLGWLLDDLTERVDHVRHALVLSNDGLVTGASTNSHLFADRVYFTPNANLLFGDWAWQRVHERW